MMRCIKKQIKRIEIPDQEGAHQESATFDVASPRRRNGQSAGARHEIGAPHNVHDAVDRDGMFSFFCLC